MSLRKAIRSSIYRYVSSNDSQLFETLIERGLEGDSKGELALQASGEISVPVLLSVSGLGKTDMSGAVCAVMVDIPERK